MILIFFATLIRVFLLGFQTLNVMQGEYLLALLTTALIAPAEVGTYIYVVRQGWSSVPAVFFGGAVGVTGAMWIHGAWIG